jgi:hypothetical protein
VTPNPRDLYSVPRWAHRAANVHLCECGRRALALVAIGVLTDGNRNGELTSVGKVYRVKSRQQTMALCPACLCIERYYRNELTYRQACEAEEVLRRETGKPAAIRKTPRGGHKAAERRVERLSCKARSLTAATVATKAIPKHRAALALLLAEAEGLLTIAAGKGGAVFQT